MIFVSVCNHFYSGPIRHLLLWEYSLLFLCTWTYVLYNEYLMVADVVLIYDINCPYMYNLMVCYGAVSQSHHKYHMIEEIKNGTCHTPKLSVLVNYYGRFEVTVFYGIYVSP